MACTSTSTSPVTSRGSCADAERLAQAIDNLLDNAIRHGLLSCSAARSHDDSAHIRVTDAGRGCRRASPPALFERFAHAGAQGRHRTGAVPRAADRRRPRRSGRVPPARRRAVAHRVRDPAPPHRLKSLRGPRRRTRVAPCRARLVRGRHRLLDPEHQGAPRRRRLRRGPRLDSSAGHPDGTSVAPRPLVAARCRLAGRPRRRPRHRLGQRATARHGRPRRRRRAGLRRAAVERRPVGRPGPPAPRPLGRGGLGARGGRRTRGVVHGDQAGLAGRGASRRRRARRPGAAPARLADLALDRPSGRGRHGPERRLRHRLLLGARGAVTANDILDRGVRPRPATAPRPRTRPRSAGETHSGALVAAGVRRQRRERPSASTCGPGDVAISIGTSGTVFASSPQPGPRPERHRRGLRRRDRTPPAAWSPPSTPLASSAPPPACSGVDLDELDRLAQSGPPDAGGLTLVPYLEGERTPDLPDASGSLVGLTRANLTPENLARAAVLGMLCMLGDALDRLDRAGRPGPAGSS